MLKLPDRLVSQAEVVSLTQEVTEVQQQLVQDHIRHKDAKAPTAKSALSGALTELLEINDLKPNPEDLAQVLVQLKALKASAPSVRIVFAIEPTPAGLQKIVSWLRQESGQPVLVRVGVQPQIAAGCIIQTPNRSFDLSLRRHLVKRAPALSEVIKRG